MDVVKIFTRESGPVLRIQPDLAKEIGLTESIVLLQLEYLISTYGVEHNGRLWLRSSTAGLVERCFGWWSADTVNRTLRKLEARRLIFIANFNERASDTTQWYALRLEGLAGLKSIRVEVATVSTEPHKPFKHNVSDFRTEPIRESDGGHPKIGCFHEDHEKNQKEIGSSTRACGSKAGVGETVDDDQIEQVLSTFSEITGRAPTAKDRASARTIAATPIEAVRRGIEQTARNARAAGIRWSALGYCLPEIDQARRELDYRAAVVGSSALVLEPEIAAEPEPHEDDKARLREYAAGVLQRFSALHGRDPSREELRAQLVEHCLEVGVDLGVVDACYPATAGTRDTHHHERAGAVAASSGGAAPAAAEQVRTDCRSGRTECVEGATPSTAADSRSPASPDGEAADGQVPAGGGCVVRRTGADDRGNDGATAAQLIRVAGRPNRSGFRAVPRIQRGTTGEATAPSVALSPADARDPPGEVTDRQAAVREGVALLRRVLRKQATGREE